MTALAGLTIADDPAVWSALGFAVEGDRVRLDGLELRLDPAAGKGVVRATAVGRGPDGVDGLDFAWTAEGPSGGDDQPNGVAALDHVVIATPDLARTLAALQAAGFELRRVREAARQGFLLAGPCVLEVVESAGAPAATFWGLAFAADLDIVAARLGLALGEVRAAVQAGRRIATLRPAAGSSVPIAFLSPVAE